MTKHAELVQAIRSRKATGQVQRFGYGIGTADGIVAKALEEIGDGLCKRYGGAAGAVDREQAIKEASDRLVCCTQDSRIEQTATVCNFKSLLPSGIEAPPHTLMVLRYTLTTGRKDRDGDVLHPDGAEVDPAGPMLWQHLFNLPIGKMLTVVEKSTKRLREVGVLLDLNELTEDCAKLFEAGALRFSHGFQAIDYRELKELDDRGRPKGHHGGKVGFEVLKYEILERSGVSIPANSDAILELHGRGKLASDVFKKQAKSLWMDRPTMVRGTGDVSAERPLGRTCCGSKLFDVAAEALPPGAMIHEWVSKYCEAPIQALSAGGTAVPAARMGSWLTALRDVTQRATVSAVRNIKGDAEVPPGYEQIELNSRQSDEFLTSGTTFMAIDGVKMVMRVEPGWGCLEVTTWCRREDAKAADAVMAEIAERAKSYKFLKGEAFRVSGEFIARTDEGWSDVFLSSENEKPLKQLAKQLNLKKDQMANRGVILLGPPGTGKTLSARVLRNETPGATFIWVSAKDFYRMGAFGGFSYAFELAKDLAPSILCFEDVDNWMEPHVVDLLKSEMDGIGRSKGVVTILTTNEPERLDQALIDRPGRFHDVLLINHPDEATRSKMLAKWAKDVDAKQLSEIVTETAGWSGAHLYELCAFAKTLAEADEQTLGDAMKSSLTKIKDQRELITAVRVRDSRYRPTFGERQSLDSWIKAGGHVNNPEGHNQYTHGGGSGGAKPPKQQPKIETNNPGAGFHGTSAVNYRGAREGTAGEHDYVAADNHAREQFHAAATAIVERHGVKPEVARNYLDSTHGRHVADHMADGKADIHAAMNAVHGSPKKVQRALREIEQQTNDGLFDKCWLLDGIKEADVIVKAPAPKTVECPECGGDAEMTGPGKAECPDCGEVDIEAESDEEEEGEEPSGEKSNPEGHNQYTHGGGHGSNQTSGSIANGEDAFHAGREILKGGAGKRELSYGHIDWQDVGNGQYTPKNPARTVNEVVDNFKNWGWKHEGSTVKDGVEIHGLSKDEYRVSVKKGLSNYTFGTISKSKSGSDKKSADGIWLTVDQMRDVCPDCAEKMVALNLRSVNIQKLEPDVLATFLRAKAGRVLSAANVQTLQECLDDLEELAGQDLPRAADALAGRIVQRLGALVDAAKPAQPTEPETEKTAETPASDGDVLGALLARAGKAELVRLRKAIDALLTVDELDARGRELRTLCS